MNKCQLGSIAITCDGHVNASPVFLKLSRELDLVTNRNQAPAISVFELRRTLETAKTSSLRDVSLACVNLGKLPTFTMPLFLYLQSKDTHTL